MNAGTGTGIRRIGERTFGLEDQRLFALVSGDRNPVHMDPVAARRLFTGLQVVHGIHILVAAIEFWRNDDGACPVSIECSFNNPVSVGDRVEFFQHDEEGSGFSIECTVDGLACSRITIGTAATPGTADADATWNTAPRESLLIAELAAPLDEAPEIHLHRRYTLELDPADHAAGFPRSSGYFGKPGFAAICALSRFVGMVCPGLHSMFASVVFEVRRETAHQSRLAFLVKKYDHRVGLFEIGFDGCIQGSLKAFLRPPPHRQPTMKEVATCVAMGEFSATRSLVIGGSRGLGELTAKILGAGGGDVVITYASGRDDAATVRDEINRGGAGRCDMLKFDLTTDSVASLEVDRDSLDAVYYFATPRIFRKKAAIFEPRLFRDLCDFYIERFYDLCAHLEGGAPGKKVKVFLPSSIFVSERPRGMAEYAMSKAAAEVLAEEINRSFRRVSVLAARLPRLNSDQTAAILKMPTGSNLETLLPVIRSLYA